jgi:undecaprenyl diphosphate synthase
MTEVLIPQHVAIIMDGNGRWAKRRNLPRIFGHKEGVSAVKRITKHAAKREIKYLTLFAFSTENWLRPKEEVSALMNLLDEYIESELRTIIEENIIFKVSGQIGKIPIKTRKKLKNAINVSSENTGMTLNLALSYGGQTELFEAAVKFSKYCIDNKLNPEDLTKDDYRNFLYHPEIPDIDLLIRTSGEKRISNFMLWRISYAELYFTNTLWPGFYEDEFDIALEDYATRQRRFGRTDEQIK